MVTNGDYQRMPDRANGGVLPQRGKVMELHQMSVHALTEKLEKAEREVAVMTIENADLRERLSSLESLYRARDKDCAAKEAELERVRAALEEEEHSHAKTIDDRDSYHDQADALAMAISELTGVDIGEHSSANNPWAEALVAIDEYKAALASPAAEPTYRCRKCGQRTNPPAPYKMYVQCECGVLTATSAAMEEAQPARHEWDDQDKCRRCGDRDWYAEPFCTPKQPAEQQPKASAGAGSDGTGAVLDTTMTAAAMKRVANELAAAAANMSDEEDDFELGLRVYPPGIVAEDDDGTPSKHPVLAVFDAEYPEEGIYPVYLSGEQQPSLASPEAEPEQKADVTALVEALEKYESAFEELFVQCCSNPVTNAWGQPVSMAALNDAHDFASSRLSTHRKQGGE